MTATKLLGIDVQSTSGNRRLVDKDLWERLVTSIMRDHAVDRPYAERVMDQALGFLRLCATSSEESYAPSTAVDIGWHTFILHTREYAAFCDRIAGRFIHHEPTDGSTIGEALGTAETLAALKSRGIVADEPLWLATAECGGKTCYSCTGNKR